MPPTDKINYYGQIKNRGDQVYGMASGRTGKLGIAELVQPKICFWDDVFILTPIYGQAHPAFPNLLAQDSSFEQQRGGYGKITTTYAGAQTPEAIERAEPTYTTKVNQRTEPVETHPDFDAIVKAVKSKFGEGPDVVQYDSDGNFLRFGTNSGEMKGVTSYLAGNLTYTYSYVSNSPTSKFNKAFKIDSPQGPKPAVGGAWLLIDAQQERKGNVYSISLTWMNGTVRGLQTMLYQ